jgi:hypothetical protein
VNTASRLLPVLVLALLAGCEPSDPEAGGEPGPSAGTPGAPGMPGAEGEEPTEADCFDVTREYSDELALCYAEVAPIPDEYIEAGCAPEGDWSPCVVETEAFTECRHEVGCASWHGALCWDTYREMTLCLGQPDPGVAPPPCQWPNDGECDEPEGTGYCIDGTDTADCGGGGGTGGTGGSDPGGGEPAPSCDPDACNGCVTDCDDYGCYSCCWACNGDACEESCNF